MKNHKLLINIFLLTAWLLAACGANSATASVAYPDSVEAAKVLKELEQALNAGDVTAALELFMPQAELIEIQPTYLISYNATGTNYIRQLSYGNQVSYRGKDWIQTYLFTLVHEKFQSIGSTYGREDDSLIWQCRVSLYDATLEMEFKALVEFGKIKFLTVTNSNIHNL